MTPTPSTAETAKEFPDLKSSILHQLRLTLARQLENVSAQEVWTAACLAVREQIMEKYIRTQKTHLEQDVRRVHYLSLEYLMGRLLESNICNLGIRDELKEALADLGFDLSELMNEEHDMGLGNGGLGRLAACFLDSMATWICLLLVMVSITSTDCLNRNLKMVNKLKSQMTGEDLATLGNCPSPVHAESPALWTCGARL